MTVIIGAGPAGMTLAYLLASNGRPVRVLERHPDFEREFRGELLQPSSLGPLSAIGLLDILAQRGMTIPDVERRLLVGPSREVMTALRTRLEKGMLVSQPGYLSVLHDACSKYPHYQLDFGTSVTGAIRDGDRVVAVTTRGRDGESEVRADAFVVCSGRGTMLRKAVGLEAETFQQPADALWLRFDFSDAVDRLPTGVDVHMWGEGVVVVLFPSRGRYLQVAYSAPGDLGALRKDLPSLEAKLLPTIPAAYREVVERKLSADTEWQILRITVDRLKTWHVPGMLFIGDAAHTMSPSGGQGLNVAIRDAIVAANHLLAEDADAAFPKIQAERLPEVEAVQEQQVRAGSMVMRSRAFLHVMLTFVSLMMWLFVRERPKAEDVRIEKPVPIS